MNKPDFLPRFVLPRLTEALSDTPVVLIHGPRQSGNTLASFGTGMFAVPIRVLWD